MNRMRALALGACVTIAGCHVVLGIGDGRDTFLEAQKNVEDASTDVTARDPDLRLCGDTWVDLNRDPNHCGACDHQCGAGRSCSIVANYPVCDRELIAAGLGSETSCLLKDGPYVYLGSNDEMLRIDVETHNTFLLPSVNDDATCSAIARHGEDLLVARRRVGGPQSILRMPLHGPEPETLWKRVEENPLFDLHAVRGLKLIGPYMYFSTSRELARVTLADGNVEVAEGVPAVAGKVLEPLGETLLWTTGTDLLRTTSMPFTGGTRLTQLSATPAATALVGSTLYILLPSRTVMKGDLGPVIAGSDAGITFETVVTLGAGQRPSSTLMMRDEYAYISIPPDEVVSGNPAEPGNILRVNTKTGALLVLARGRLRPEFVMDGGFVYFVQEPSDHPDDSPTLVRVPW